MKVMGLKVGQNFWFEKEIGEIWKLELIHNWR